MTAGNKNMNGKVCMVTGATSGIGLVTAKELARMGANVIVVGRDEARGVNAVSEIQRETGSKDVEHMLANFASQVEVRRLAGEFTSRHERLDVLVNNAGTYLLMRRESDDGLEMTFAVNHIAPFLLTNLLLDILKSSAPSRVVNVSSGSHLRAQIDFDDLQMKKRYNGMKAYGRSKLANVLFTYELARRLGGAEVTSNALHPGFVITNMGSDNGPLIHFFARLFMRLKGIPTHEGAQTSIFLASSPEVKGVSGKYFFRCKPVRSSELSYDIHTAERLWRVSEDMTETSVNSS
ncbi:MAG: SDR family NAD(P)-dependent oxidoreductase [Anaerolineales bacterium]|nr:SDR family NAD(P)-dependent oxidoreductase [Anaerolineales bacterium]